MGERKTIQRLLKETLVEGHTFVVALLLYLPVTLFALSQPMIIGVAVEKGFKTQDTHQVLLWASIFSLVVVCHSMFEMLQLYSLQKVGFQVVKKLRAKLFEKVQSLPLSYFDQTPLGRILTRTTNDVESVSEFFSSGSVSIIGDILFLVGTLLMLLLVDFKLSLASLTMMPFLAFGLWIMRRWMREGYHWVRLSLSKVNTYLQEYLSGMQTVQLLNQVGRVRAGFEKSNEEYLLSNRRVIFLDAAIYSLVDAISTTTVAVVLWYGFELHQDGLLKIGVMVAFIEALSRFFQPVRELSSKYTVVQSALVSSERIFELLDLHPEGRRIAATAQVSFEKEIAFKDVSFAYDKGRTPVLNQVSFRVKKGERIALVGHTGAGKSTITRLLTGFYEITQGQITFDGVDIRQLETRSVRKLFNVVPQEVFLFSGTLRENLKYAREDASDEEVFTALQLCQSVGWVLERGGLEAEVSARGRNFSLGERQLLALARALVADPAILIWDEATASIDTQTESRLKAATKELLKGRTALIVAHRLSTIKDCDRILVLHKGSLAEEGNHETLMKQKGIYAKLVELQEQAKRLESYFA